MSSTQTKTTVSLGHLRLEVDDVPKGIDFFEAIGAETFRRQDNFAVIAFDDGTHLHLAKGAAAGPDVQFDLRVKDLDAAWADYKSKGLNPSDITRTTAHDHFIVPGPENYQFKVNSPFKGG